MAIPVKLPVVEGPLDLLLHLIEKNKIDIYDIPIVEVTHQYMEYVRSLKGQDMEVTSEFMVMAATLLDIKCRMLLPRTVGEDGEEEDPRSDLVQRLLEYKLYRYMAQELRERMDESGGAFYHKKDLPEEVKGYEEPVVISSLLEGLTLERLQKIYKGLVKKQTDRVDTVRSQFGKIEKEPVSVSEKMLEIRDYCMDNREFTFSALLLLAHSRTAVVVSFLCILELMKMGHLKAEQDALFADIRLTVLDEPSGWRHLTEDAEEDEEDEEDEEG